MNKIIKKFILYSVFSILFYSIFGSFYLNPPLVFLGFIAFMPLHTNKIIGLTTSFLLGLIIDFYAGDLGFYSLIACILFFIKNIGLDIIFKKNNTQKTSNNSFNLIINIYRVIILIIGVLLVYFISIVDIKNNLLSIFYVIIYTLMSCCFIEYIFFFSLKNARR